MKRFAFLLLAIPLLAQSNREAGDELAQGLASYKASRFPEAVTHLKRALQMDANNTQAQLSLATTYAAMWVAGLQTADNIRLYDLAVQQFKAVLEKDPNQVQALSGMALLTYTSSSFGAEEARAAAIDEAAEWNRRLVAVRPNEPEPYYNLGMIAWSKVYVPIQAARTQLKMDGAAIGPIPDAAMRDSLSAQYGKTIEEGLDNLKQCLNLDPKNGDAMTYLALLLRKKGDLEASADAARFDNEQAAEYIQKSVVEKQSKIAATAPAPETAAATPPPPPPGSDSSGNAPQRISPSVAAEMLEEKAAPICPSDFKCIRGTVEFSIVISAEGNVESTFLLRGNPLLVPAARDAVMQWRYRPLLSEDGRAVRATTNVVVNFPAN